MSKCLELQEIIVTAKCCFSSIPKCIQLQDITFKPSCQNNVSLILWPVYVFTPLNGGSRLKTPGSQSNTKKRCWNPWSNLHGLPLASIRTSLHHERHTTWRNSSIALSYICFINIHKLLRGPQPIYHFKLCWVCVCVCVVSGSEMCSTLRFLTVTDKPHYAATASSTAWITTIYKKNEYFKMSAVCNKSFSGCLFSYEGTSHHNSE